MDKHALLERVTNDAEDRLLLARILDKYEQCRSRNVPTHSTFLSPRQQCLAQDLLHVIAPSESCVFSGGYEEAERKMLFFLPDWCDGTDDSESIAWLRCHYHPSEKLTHRDFLGSLMGLSITREKIGDILLGEGSADTAVDRQIAPYLLSAWESAGRVRLRVEQIESAQLHIPVQKLRIIHTTVAAMRLDAVCAAGFTTSRSKAAELIRSGSVSLNHRETKKADAPVRAGDVISARGLGKCKVAECGGSSRKGRCILTLHRFL